MSARVIQVHEEGFEPTRLAALDPKSCAGPVVRLLLLYLD